MDDLIEVRKKFYQDDAYLHGGDLVSLLDAAIMDYSLHSFDAEVQGDTLMHIVADSVVRILMDTSKVISQMAGVDLLAGLHSSGAEK